MRLVIEFLVALACAVFAMDVWGQQPSRMMRDQMYAERIFEEQEEAERAFIESIEKHEFTTTKKDKFQGKFLSVQGSIARILSDGHVYRVPLTKLSEKDKLYIREQVKIRKGIKTKTKS